MQKILIALALGTLLFSTGCEIEKWARGDDKGNAATDSADGNELKDDGKPHYVISINETVKYPRAEELEREIPTYDGRTVWINTNPFIHSRNIRAIELLPSAAKKGFYSLKIELNRRGKLIWMQIAVQFRNHPLAFIVDGTLYRTFLPQPLLDDNTGIIVIEGPFDVYTAKAIQRYAQSNYKIFNPDEKEQ